MRKGQTMSEASKRKVSESLIGQKHSDETRKRMSESHRKQWKDPLYRQNQHNGLIKFWNNNPKLKRRFSEAKTGTKLSKETRRKISQKLKGNQNGLGNKSHLGQKHSETHKRKISKAIKGRVLSKEHKEKKSKAQKQLWENLEYRVQQSKKISKTMKKLWEDYDEEYKQQQRAKMLKGLLKRPTSLERQFIKICQKNNLPFRYVGNGDFFIGSRNPDFVHNEGKKLCIEVANTIPLHHPKGYAEERTQYFSGFGWDCIVFMGNKLDEDVILSKLQVEAN